MEKKNNGKTLIKVCCVIVSFCLWLYISNYENPISTYTIKNVSVELINSDTLAQSNFTLTPNQKFSVPITIRGTDVEVNKARASDFKIVADMSTYAVKEGENKIPVQIVHYPPNVNIENNTNMWVDVVIDKTKEKNVSVIVKASGKPKHGYYSLEPTFSQSEVTVSGPSKLVDLVSGVSATADVDNLNKDLTTEEALEAVDKTGKTVSDITIKPAKIQVTVPIKKNESSTTNVAPEEKQSNKTNSTNINGVTPGNQQNVVNNVNGNNTNTDSIIEKTFSANISVINVPDGFNSTLDATVAVKVTVSGKSTVINAIKDGDIKGTIDGTSFKEGVNVGQPEVVNLPQGAQSVAIAPTTINVTLTKK